MNKKPVCTINLDCPVDRPPCPNYWQCNDLSISWELPYEVKSDGLFVKKYGCRREWYDTDLYFGSPMNRCSVEGGYWKPYEEGRDEHCEEMNQRMKEAWALAGWCVAEPINSKPASVSVASKLEDKVLNQIEYSNEDIPF